MLLKFSKKNNNELFLSSSFLGLLQRIGELECDLKGLQGEVQKYRIEQETIQSKLSEKAKVNLRAKSWQLSPLERRVDLYSLGSETCSFPHVSQDETTGHLLTGSGSFAIGNAPLYRK